MEEGGAMGEQITLSITRGTTGRRETLIKKGDVMLYEEDWIAWGNRVYGYE
jgi:hypothetical protein